jgi:hypothetical protein
MLPTTEREREARIAELEPIVAANERRRATDQAIERFTAVQFHDLELQASEPLKFQEKRKGQALKAWSKISRGSPGLASEVERAVIEASVKHGKDSEQVNTAIQAAIRPLFDAGHDGRLDLGLKHLRYLAAAFDLRDLRTRRARSSRRPTSLAAGASARLTMAPNVIVE